MKGTVVDATGSVIPDATVVLVNAATAFRYSTATDPPGRFAFDRLPPGDYVARAPATGMFAQMTPRLQVAVGGLTELQFKRPGIWRNSRIPDELPVDGADKNNALFSEARGRYRAPYQFSNEVVQNLGFLQTPMMRNWDAPEAGWVNVVTKSGSNQLHGSDFYLLRDGGFGGFLARLHLCPRDRRWTGCASGRPALVQNSYAPRLRDRPTYSTGTMGWYRSQKTGWKATPLFIKMIQQLGIDCYPGH